MTAQSTTESTVPPTVQAQTELVALPAPVGAFDLPLGFMLIPDSPDTAEARAALLAGNIPSQWPEAMHAHQLAWEGQFDAARDALTGDDPVSRFNRFVIEPPTQEAPQALDQLAAELGPQLAPLVRVVGFALGFTPQPPALPTADHSASPEITALVLAAHATAAASAEDYATATDHLRAAVAHATPAYPALAGVLSGALATVIRGGGGQLADVLPVLKEGTELLADTDLNVARAEQFLELGSAFQENGQDRPDLLQQAVHQYHSALQCISAQDAPDLFAATHANLASAYLTMPMTQASDQLRIGVAVASMRAALEIYTPETHPQRWASVQLNLANALVYSPSTHQGDNIVEAVELYEKILEVRDRDSDPLSYARVLANQGNALAHLGMFEHARGKLVEARFIFEEFRDYDGAHTVRGLLDEIARAISENKDTEAASGADGSTDVTATSAADPKAGA